jgi:hypothetical protein
LFAPGVIKGGVTVAKEIELEYEFENMGAKVASRRSRTSNAARRNIEIAEVGSISVSG